MVEDKGQEKYHGIFSKCSKLLELAANDDVEGFASMVEEKGFSIDDTSLWYGKRNGGEGKMGFEERTPLMIASLYGSSQVLKYIISSNKVDVNKSSDSDGAAALHCAAAGGSHNGVMIVKLLLEASADVNLADIYGNKPVDLIARGLKSSKRRILEILLNGFVSDGTDVEEVEEKETVSAKKEYPVDVSMPDINNGVYGSDEFRMYTFKVKPCSRAYTHDWTECPFVHPGENARRRDLKKFNYSCVPCPEFRKGSCAKGDLCEYAHGVFESWLHPAQYKTRLCKDEIGCARKVCFFAHTRDEMRPVYASTGSALPSPKSTSVPVTSVEMGSMSPLSLVAQAVMNSRSGSFTKQRSQSFIDRGAGLTMSPRSIPQQSCNLSEWGSPNGKLDWGFSSEDANKLRKSASFGYRGNAAAVHSSPKMQTYGDTGADKLPHWIEQMYIEQEQMVA
ncbi:zinc finger (CCCH-type) family protein [Artemisia annua]|uniref:Zinc finger (CCCH-type) family protein n=1 Tax=Artemisia annua TaxID=35608 RepID=A0A2U1Q9C5_ARTAN|nr:zinc finger (CCCH-type) family protein [Artemisia annua]